MKVYLDYAATTPLDKRVFKAMSPLLGENFGNPASLHAFGREALRELDAARDKVAQILGADPSEIYFTSSGSEADNWALKCAARAARQRTGRTQVVVSAMEHHAVLGSAAFLAEEGFDVRYLSPAPNGLFDVADVANALSDETALVCVMTVNNEIGTVQPVREIARAAHAAGALFFTDAVQAAGYMDIGKSTLEADMVSLSAHKFYGPKGVGALFVKRGTPFGPLIHGGEQERGLRGGTSNPAGAVGLAAALAYASEEREENNEHIRAVRDRFLDQLFNAVDGASLNGDFLRRIPSNANVSFAGVDGSALLHRLDLAGIAVSLGSACASGAVEPSHVLTAMGLPTDRVKSAVRFSFGKYSTFDEAEYVVKVLSRLLPELRGE